MDEFGHPFFGWDVENFGVEDVPSADKLGKGVEEGVEESIKLRIESDRSLHQGCWGKSSGKMEWKEVFGRDVEAKLLLSWSSHRKTLQLGRRGLFHSVKLVSFVCVFLGAKGSPSVRLADNSTKGTCSGPKSFIMYVPSLFCSSQDEHEHVRHINKIKPSNMNPERAWMWIYHKSSK